jgi:deoxycytidine triphosphate deaminase
MILCDREVERAMDYRLIVIEPRPGLELMNSTTIDLRLDAIRDVWEFPPP